uniref:Ig-like domain-containing protein n=1 Tax=Myripristis murdjan TaxID=586833 RepID=A0A667YHQ8_9TELE
MLQSDGDCLRFSLLSSCVSAGQKLKCCPAVTVRPGTNLTASPGEQLHVNCPVTFCSDSPPTVTWLKTYENIQERVSRTDQIQTSWRSLTENSGIAVLQFTNISADDAGVYQCYFSDYQGTTRISHYISVTVTGKAAGNLVSQPPTQLIMFEHTRSFLFQHGRRGVSWERVGDYKAWLEFNSLTAPGKKLFLSMVVLF